MAAEEDADTVDEQILYDLIVNAEWSQGSDIVNSGTDLWFVGEPFPWKYWRLFERSTSSILNYVRNYVKFRSENLFGRPPSCLIDAVNCKLDWDIAISRNGKLLAVLQNTCIEIRSHKDDFHKVVTKINVPNDPYPQWRKLAWSASETLIAYSSSAGDLHCFDLFGSQVFASKEPAKIKIHTPSPFLDAISTILFKKLKLADDWVEELVYVTYGGALKSYRISSSHTFKAGIVFNLMKYHPMGVSNMLHHETLDLLIVAGCYAQTDPAQTDGALYASDAGITCWRLVSDEPYLVSVEDKGRGSKQGGKKDRFRLPGSGVTDRCKNGTFQMCLSPKQSELLTLHVNGQIILWKVPGMAMITTWQHESSSGAASSEPNNGSVKLNVAQSNSQRWKSVVDVNWWSNNAVILMQGQGALTVSSKSRFYNLLGESPEWFEPWSVTTPTINGQCLILEFETKITSQAHADPVRDAEDEEHREWLGDHKPDTGIMAHSKQYLKQAIYFVTEMEKFQPPVKPAAVCEKVYRLVSLKSTTPEELYSRKIDVEEYGEALTLAQRFNLNTDRVYERQWRNRPVTVITIHDYLTKIKDRMWVLTECLQRVPDDVDAAYKLLKYGLQGTDLKILKRIDKDGENLPFVLPSDDDEEEDNEEMIDTTCLSKKQLQLCLFRFHILQCMDRLATYEEILGGHIHAKERYSQQFFERFRYCNIVQECVAYARQSDAESCDILATYHPKDVLPHWLTILSNFPETTPPTHYRFLLPEVSCADEGVISPWSTKEHRQPDWVEQPEILRQLDIDLTEDHGEFLYEASPEMKQYRNSTKAKKVRQWYVERVHSIENNAKQVDHSFTLVKLAKERGFKGLDDLYDVLSVLEVLTYECGIQMEADLKEFEEMSHLGKLRLLLSSSTSDSFMGDFKRWGQPFLQKVKKKTKRDTTQLLHHFFTELAKSDLTLPLKIFEKSTIDCPEPLIPDVAELMRLAIECVYICKRDDQLALAFSIVECLPPKEQSILSDQIADLHERVDQLELLLSGAEILELHSCSRPVSALLDLKSDLQAASSILEDVINRTLNRQVKPTLADFNTLLRHLNQLQEDVCTCVTKEKLVEIFAVCLLRSGVANYIELVSDLVTSKSPNQSRSSGASSHVSGKERGTKLTEKCTRLGYQRSVEIVVEAGKEYFNSASGLKDASMDLARTCLSLIHDKITEVQDELDLIEALSILSGFSFVLLPLQVRLCHDKLGLIRQCVAEKASNYKKMDKILKLASLLGVCRSETEAVREGRVLVVIGESAFQSKDYIFVHDICNRLIGLNFSDAWTICRALADCNEYSNLIGRKKLLSFALTYCHADQLDSLLMCRSLLETQLLYQQLGASVEAQRLQRDGSLIDKTVSQVSNKTKAIVSNLKDNLWSNRSAFPSRFAGAESATGRASEGKHCVASLCQTYQWHPFYSTVHTDLDKDRDLEILSLQKFLDDPDWSSASQQTNLILLRTHLLANARAEKCDAESSSAVLMDLFWESASHDTHTAMGYLLALPDGTDADEAFESAATSSFRLQLICYYYALQIYGILKPSLDADMPSLYLVTPLKLIEVVHRGLPHHERMDQSGSLPGLAKQFKLFANKLSDMVQANTLKGLGKGVDVQRFVQDDEYKRETILGLAMTLDDDLLETAMFLARKYSISEWNVVFSNVEFLFTDSGLSAKELGDRVTKLKPQSVLAKNPGELLHKARRYIYDDIPGTDHARLVLFFALLAECCGDSILPETQLDVNSHLRILKKVKAAASGVDYKRLVGGEAPLQTLESCLTENNVHLLAKIASKIPLRDGFLSSSNVFMAFIVKLFWEGSKPSGAEHSDWLHRYEMCQKFFNRIDPSDVGQFVAKTTCVGRSVDELPLDIRVAITSRTLKFAKQSQSKEEKKADTDMDRWKAVNHRFQQLLLHFKHLEEDAFLELYHSDDLLEKEYSRRFDLSCCDTSAVNQLLTDMAFDGQPPEAVHNLSVLARAVSSDVARAVDAFNMAIRSAMTIIKEGDSATGICKFEQLVDNVQLESSRQHPVVLQEDVLELVREFCLDAEIAPALKNSVMQIVEQKFHLGGKDMLLLLYYQTDAIVASTWAVKIEECNIDSDQHRHELLLSLLEQCTSRPQFAALTELLLSWPVLAAAELGEDKPDSNPWIILFDKMIFHDNYELLLDSIGQASTQTTFGTECYQFVYERLASKDSLLSAFKLAFISGDELVIDKAFEDMALFPANRENDDRRLHDLILQSGLLHRVCHTPFYCPLMSFLTSIATNPNEDEKQLLADAISQLQRGGLIAEASHLSAKCSSLHLSYYTINNALSILRSWMQKR